MCDQTEISYLDEEVVWVKLGSCWWPGEVVAPEKLSPELLRSFRKPPIAIVKFFQEDAYEYVKNINSIYKYQCSRKNEFINKGLSLYRNKHGLMEKFPEDVIRAETKVGGDIEILTREEFQETKKESYAGLFGTPAKKTPGSIKKGRGRPPAESPKISTPVRRMKEKTDYKVHILVQGSKPPVTPESPTTPVPPTPSTSTSTEETAATEESTPVEQKPDDNTIDNVDTSIPTLSTPVTKSPSISTLIPQTPIPISVTPSTPASASGSYACHACNFTTSRLNVLIMHNKTHSISFMPYIPTPKKKTYNKSTPVKTPKPKPERKKPEKPATKKVNKKRPTEEKGSVVENKKVKTDEEIKSSLLADWDDGDEDSNYESASAAVRSPSVPFGAQSPAEPTPAELPRALVPPERTSSPDRAPPPSIDVLGSPHTDKPESSSDTKYDFCEDEDWPVEADAGRKIPRVKNPVRTDETKSISIDEDDMAREVAELLNKTAVPELPSVPEPLKVEENFPEPSVVKSPDKVHDDSPGATDASVAETPPTKAIFKTKTFFRSRHSRSQDAIGKYVAEQLNNVEKMDIADCEINGSDNVSSPEARDSPPIEPVKVARLAPKIQLKKLKAEAQLREKSRNRFEPSADPYSLLAGDIMGYEDKPESPLVDEIKDKEETSSISTSSQDALYLTQEAKPVIETNTTKEIAETPTETNNTFMESEETSEITHETHQENASEPSQESSYTKLDHKQNEPSEDLEIEEESTQDSVMTNNGSKENSVEVPDIKSPQPLLRDTPELAIGSFMEEDQPEQPTETFMNASTASAVDALLSVSREADRVTRVISDDPPEDLFEDDKDGSITNDETIETMDIDQEPEKTEEVQPQHSDYVSEAFSEEMDHEPSSLCNNEQEMDEIHETSTTSTIHDQIDDIRFPESEEIPPNHEEMPESAYSEIEKETPSIHKAIENDVLPQRGEIQEDTENHSYAQNELEIPITNEETEKGYFLNNFTESEQEVSTSQNESEQVSEDGIFLQNEDIPAVHDETEIPIDNNPDEYIGSSEPMQNEEVVTTPHYDDTPHETVTDECVVENVPSESDLQIAEALINLPATALHNNPAPEHENEIMTTSFDMDNVQEEIVPASDNVAMEETVPPEKASESTNELEEQFNDESSNVRFETEQEKCENLNAAQSLLHMSESIEHKIGLTIPDFMDTSDGTESVVPNAKQNNGLDKSMDGNISKISTDTIKEPEKSKSKSLHSSSKLLQILEEPSKLTFGQNNKPTKQIVMRGKEKILNFDVAKSSFKSKPQSPKQKIIIRRTTPGKSIINNINEIGQDKIILSRSGNQSQEGSSVQTFTIQTKPDTPSDANTIIIQQKIRKVAKPASKLQKLKSHPALVASSVGETKSVTDAQPIDNAMFDINSMPIVLSEDLITAESIEKMPVVMSDANIMSQPRPQQPTKIVKQKQIKETEKVTVTSMPKKQEMKTLLINPISDVNKSSTPNILSKSAKLRAAKPMLVIDKSTGKQKIIMTKTEPTIKEIKQIQAPQTMLQTQTLIQSAPTLIQASPNAVQSAQTLVQSATKILHSAPQTLKKSSQPEKFIILPTQNTQRTTGRTQKIVIDPATGKAHVILSKGSAEPVATVPENKPVSAKLMPTKSDTHAPGNTVMIITNAQGAQSRIVLTPEHEKILFPKKQQQKASQLKPIAQRITTANAMPQMKTVLNPSPAPAPAPVKQLVTATKPPTRIVPKQKNAIITSKGQLILGGRVATTAQNIAPMPEIRPVPKRAATAEPRKLVQAVQKSNSEPIIFLQQKSGAVMQLTASQFERLQRTGQIVQKTSPPPAQAAQPAQLAHPVPEGKRVVLQKSRTIVEAGGVPPKARLRKSAHAAHSPAPKKMKHEIAIAPAPSRTALPDLAPVQSAPEVPTPPPALAPAAAVVTFAPVAAASTATPSSSFTEFENFEELLPAAAIARQLDPPPPPPPPPPAPAPESEAAPFGAAEGGAAGLADGQLLAVPGEHFGGPVGSFYLCVEERGSYTPIDNRPLVLDNDQLVPMPEQRRDILEAALANSDVFRAPDAPLAPDFRDLNANVSVHCRVSETSTTLHQPIMTPVEVPSAAAPDAEPPPSAGSLDAHLAAIGVTPHAVATSLELPITVTDPRIAPRASDPLGALAASPAADLRYVSAAEATPHRPISMPLLTEEEGADGAGGGKSMPILTDEVSPASPSEPPAWARRPLAPASASDDDLSAEIPLQPALQLSLSEHT